MATRRTGPRRRHGPQRETLAALEARDGLLVLQLEYGFFRGMPLDELEAAWAEHREELQERWATGHQGPCFAERYFDQGEFEAAGDHARTDS